MKKYLFLLIMLFSLLSFTSEMHPYHVGSLEFNYKSKSETFQITGKFFLDDVENAVSEKYGKILRFHQRSQSDEMNAALEKYCEENIHLKSNGKLLKIKYLGFEEDRESVRIYLESEPVKLPQQVEVATGFLYSLFDDQLNIIHVVVNGKRQSHQLRFPDRYLSKTF